MTLLVIAFLFSPFLRFATIFTTFSQLFLGRAGNAGTAKPPRPSKGSKMDAMPTDEDMLRELREARESVEDFPVLRDGATDAEVVVHDAMVNNWKARLFLKWQQVCLPRPGSGMRL